MHVCMLFEQVPVQPAGLVVLTPGVIISALCAPHFVAHRDHRKTQGDHRDGEKILDETVAKRFDCRIIRWPFRAPVVAAIVIGSIASLFPVLLVVLLAVGDEVVERESVMAGYKVHTLLCFACLMSIDFGTADK